VVIVQNVGRLRKLRGRRATVPPNSAYARYKQHIRNYLHVKLGWDRIDAVTWLNENADFVRQMLATEATYKQTANAINEMEKRINAK
jgi:hypothetical protein